MSTQYKSVRQPFHVCDMCGKPLDYTTLMTAWPTFNEAAKTSGFVGSVKAVIANCSGRPRYEVHGRCAQKAIEAAVETSKREGK